MLATLLTTLSHPPPAGVSSVGARVGVVGDVGDGDGDVSTRCVADEMSVWPPAQLTVARATAHFQSDQPPSLPPSLLPPPSRTNINLWTDSCQ